LAEAVHDRTEPAEGRRPERVEAASESTPAVSAQVFGRVGDRNDLAAMNSHTRDSAGGSSNSLEFSDPFKSANSDFIASLGRQSGNGIAGGARGGAEEVAGRARTDAPGRPNVPDALRQFMAPPTDPALLKDGVVKITPTFPGTGRFTLDGSAEGTGFLINANGDRGPSKPGEQLIGTADHVVEDRLRQSYQLGANLFADKSELSKADLEKKGNEVVAGVDDKKAQQIFKSNRDYARDELSYLSGNFDQIQKVSKELNPNAKGITLDGLDEYRRRNTTLDVETAAGHFNAKIANRDPGTDVAVLRISGLKPDEQKRIGPNREFETSELAIEQPVKSVGFKKSVDSKIDGLEQVTSLKDTKESITLDQALEKGMSGGPTFANNFKVIGINHATDRRAGIGFITPITELRPLLQEIAQGKVKFRRSLD
jgi:hypothetical protein